MRPVKRLSAWVGTLAGLFLLALAARAGWLALALAALPGLMMIAGAAGSLLVPDMRTHQHCATGAALGLLLALPIGLAGGTTLGLAALLLACVAFLAAGWLSISLEPTLDEVPAPAPTLVYSALVALDDATMNFMMLFNPSTTADELRDAVRESEDAHALLTERGWFDKPQTFHSTPPAIQSVDSAAVRIKGLDCEHIRFESGYDPDPALPGRDRWLGYQENQTAHAWVLRHAKPGPWLVCVHGFGMGDPARDFPVFRAAQLHRGAGLNLAFIALPVHGPRAPGSYSGREFMALSPLDFVHAEAQAVWDIRRLMGWIRAQEATQLGIYGISLGAYTSAVVAGLEDGLDCVIAGIPPSDLIATAEHLASSLERRINVAAGVSYQRDREIHRVVSPLTLPPRLSHDRRFIFAATGDRFVPLAQVRALWQHWERPQISWCRGGHLSAQMQRDPRALVDQAIAQCLTNTQPVPEAS